MRALQPKKHNICRMKICMMIRVQRLFNTSLANESRQRVPPCCTW